MAEVRVKLLPKLILFSAIVGGGVFAFQKAIYYGVIPRPNILKTVVPLKTEDVHAEVLSNPGNVKALPVPSNAPASVSGPHVNYEIWGWNAQMGLIYANGGPQTTKGSLMEKQSVNLSLKRNDDTGQMQNDLVTFATALSKGQDNPQEGTHFVNIMGDGSAQFFAAVNPKLERLGADYRAEIVGMHGYSRGEDGFWGLPDWKTDPQAAKGSLIAGVLRDGDWNIAMKWEGMNNVPNNPDEKTYDPQAVNWVNADTYTKAAEMYVQNYCEDRPLKDKRSQIKHICVNGVVTWTPGDVTVAKKRGGLVPLLTTKQSTFQMPCVMIGIRKWDQTHRDVITNILAASYQAADQIRTNPDALQKAGEFSYLVYKEETADYWVKYYKGVSESDMQGIRVPLGGSAVSNLADSLQLFGLAENSGNIMKADYETFGNIVVQQYPNLVPSYPKYADVVDASYVAAAKGKALSPTNNAETVQTYAQSTPMKEIVGRRNYSIQFRTGSAEILPASYPVLNQIYDDVIMTSLAVAIHGHTDNTGTPQGNIALSKARAESVREYFRKKAPENFSEGRVRVYAHGQDEPIAENTNAEGRAKNRRVQIVLGTLE